jgi:hypothetical protein
MARSGPGMPRKDLSDALAALTRAVNSASLSARRRRFLSCSVSLRADSPAKGFSAVRRSFTSHPQNDRHARR